MLCTITLKGWELTVTVDVDVDADDDGRPTSSRTYAVLFARDPEGRTHRIAKGAEDPEGMERLHDLDAAMRGVARAEGSGDGLMDEIRDAVRLHAAAEIHPLSGSWMY
jgi:hypothetical protein